MNLLLRQVASGVHARAMESALPRPTDEAVVRSGADDPVRVLLVGSGITTGWGVRTHGLALAGLLQQELQARLGQPVDVEQVSGLGTLLADAPQVLGAHARQRWDVIVLAFGLSDAVRLTPAREWAQALDRLLAQLDGDLPRGLPVPVVIAGIPPEPLADPGIFGAIYTRQAERLNAITARAAERNRRTTFAALPTMADRAHRPSGSPEGYRSWAAAIADRAVPLMPRVAEVAAHAPDGPRGRLTTAALDPVNAVVRHSLQTLARTLQAATDVDLVVIDLLDDDRLWSVADSVEGRPRSVAVAGTFCAVVLQEDVLQVADAASDPRFAAPSSTGLHRFDSYAGIALRDAHGTAVGTIGFFDGEAGAGIDPTVLRRAARDVETQLARLVSVLDGGAIFPQRGFLPDEVHADRGSGAGLPAPGSEGPRPAPVPAAGADDALGSTRRIGRRRRLRVGGRELTRVAAARSIPAGHDVRIRGPQPIRVLLVGADYAVGHGTRTRAEALDGALARVLHTRTGRGVVVENRSQEGVRLEQLAASLGPAGAHTFDLVVWTPTFEEGSRVLLRARWLAGIGLMLRKIETTSDAAVILAGFPNLVGNQPLAVLGRARAAQINRMLALIARSVRRCVMVVPPDIVLGDVETMDGRTVYQAVAVRLLPAVMALLPAVDGAAAPAAAPVVAPQERLQVQAAGPAPVEQRIEQGVLSR